MMQAHPATLGVILAGGLARRMGGGDKVLREIGGRPMLAHVIARLAPQTRGLLLNANGDPARFAAFGLPVAADPLPDNPGPLAGVLAGLDWAAVHAPGVAWVVSVPGDTPFVPHDLVARLHAARGEAAFACAASGGRPHPAVALWPVAEAAALRAALQGGLRRVSDYAGSRAVGVAEWAVAPYDPFFNVNDVGDLAAAARLA